MRTRFNRSKSSIDQYHLSKKRRESTHAHSAWMHRNSFFVNEAPDGESRRAVFFASFNFVAPGDWQIVHDPMMLIIEMNAVLEKVQQFQIILFASYVGFRAKLLALTFTFKGNLKKKTLMCHCNVESANNKKKNDELHKAIIVSFLQTPLDPNFLTAHSIRQLCRSQIWN